MKAIVLHNPEAGNGAISHRQLQVEFEAIRCEMIYQSTKEKGYHKVLQQPADVVVVAGGDGTVRKALCRIADTPGTPVLILALGTANNIASSLGVLGDWRNRIRHLRSLQPYPFYFGSLKYGDVKEYFFESVGIGVFADHLRLIEENPHLIDEMVAAGEGYTGTYEAMAEMAEETPAVNLTIEMGGESREASVVWLELLNIPKMGPQLSFYTQDKPQIAEEFKLLEITEDKRDVAARWFRNGASDNKLGIRAISAKETIKLSGKLVTLHIDDEYEKLDGEEVTLKIKRAKDPVMILK